MSARRRTTPGGRGGQTFHFDLRSLLSRMRRLYGVGEVRQGRRLNGDLKDGETRLGLYRVVQAEGACADFWDGFALETKREAGGHIAGEGREVLKAFGARTCAIDQAK